MNFFKSRFLCNVFFLYLQHVPTIIITYKKQLMYYKMKSYTSINKLKIIIINVK